MAKIRQNRPSWDETFVKMCQVIAQRSPDPDYQVGCVIARQDNVVVGIGYNGAPRAIAADQVPWDSEDKHFFVCHAEFNAILNANSAVVGCKLYTLLFPCFECMKMIIQSGIRDVYYRDDSKIGKGNPKFVKSREMAEMAGVNLHKLDF